VSINGCAPLICGLMYSLTGDERYMPDKMKKTDDLPIYARTKGHTIHGHLLLDTGDARWDALMELILEAVQYGRDDHDLIAFNVCKRPDGVEIRVAYQPRTDEFKPAGRML